MAATLVAWLIITLVCWACGYVFLGLMQPALQEKLPHFSLVCFVGFAVVMVLTSFLSLVTKINSFILLIALVLTLMYLLFCRTAKILLQNFLQAFSLPPSFLLLLITGSLLVLVMSVWHIIHPDTVEYHAAIIDSIKRQGLIKGYAKVSIRYGLQSNWFVACSLFSFDIGSQTTLTFANSAILFWFLLFVSGKLTSLHNNEKFYAASILLFYLCISFLDFTQIRLTSVSASPDFIAAIYILLAFYLFLARQTSEVYFVVLLFCATAITIKLSSFSLALLLLYLFITAKNFRVFVLAFFLVAFTMLPLLLRNFSTSGYILFPTTAFPIGSPSWRLDSSSVHRIKQYITAYARTASDITPGAVQQTLKLAFWKWMPLWWQLRNFGQKLMLFPTLATLIKAILNAKKIYQVADRKKGVSLCITFIGLVTWFLLAPDPRFGIAWLILVHVLVLPTVLRPQIKQKISGTFVLCLSYFLCFGLFVYFVYRIHYYFDIANLFFPYGLR